ARLAKVAAQLVRSALADLEQVQLLEESLAPEGPLDFDRRTAALVRGMYEKWAQETQLLLDRLDRGERRFGAVAPAANLRDAYGRTMAMLSISLDDMEQGLRDVAEGRTHGTEEVRRELHLRPQ